MKKFKFEITKEDEGRLDKILSSLTLLNRKIIQENIKHNGVIVNETMIFKSSFNLVCGDIVFITIDEAMKNDEFILKPWHNSNIIDIVNDSDNYFILNKPSGIVIHPAKANYDYTLANAILAEFKDLDHTNNIRPGIVHRIDKDTSGILIISKTTGFTNFIQDKFKNREIQKTYLAFIEGTLNFSKGQINAPIGKNIKRVKHLLINGSGAKEALTDFELIKNYDNYALIAFYPKTGRTHQIRVHAEYIGHPIYNDPIYSKVNYEKYFHFGQFLHAFSLAFNDMDNNKVMYKVSPPKEFYDLDPDLDNTINNFFIDKKEKN